MSALDDAADLYAEELAMHRVGECGEDCYWCEEEAKLLETESDGQLEARPQRPRRPFQGRTT